MSRFARWLVVLVLVGAEPAVSIAVPSGGGGRPSGARVQQSHPAPPQPPHPAPPQPRPVTPDQGGFNFNHDTSRGTGTTQQRTFVTQHPAYQQQTQRTGPNFPHASNVVGGGGPYAGRFHGRSIPNPRHWNGTWGWNRGIAWLPAAPYWGGGFWGPLAVVTLGNALLFGSIIDYQDRVIYPSYQVEADSPGAQLLESYGLQQTQCGPPNLVVIWGPDNSVICAYPNDLVGPGNYDLDPSTLTIVSDASQ